MYQRHMLNLYLTETSLKLENFTEEVQSKCGSIEPLGRDAQHFYHQELTPRR